MVLGVYYLTMLDPQPRKGDGRVFGSLDEVEMVYELGQVHVHAKVKLMLDTYFDEDNKRYIDGEVRRRIIETTVGRALFNRIVPAEMRYVNRVLDKGDLQRLVNLTPIRCLATTAHWKSWHLWTTLKTSALSTPHDRVSASPSATSPCRKRRTTILEQADARYRKWSASIAAV